MPHQEHTHCTGAPVSKSDEQQRYKKLFLVTSGICIFQLAGAWLASSLGLISDSVHVASDSTAALISLHVAKTVAAGTHADEPSFRRRWVLLSGAILLASLCWVIYEAIFRFQELHDVNGGLVMFFATVGGAGNVWQHKLIPHGTETAEIQRLHVEGDLYSSVAVVVGGIIILLTGWNPIDSLLSIGIALFVGWFTIQAMRGKKQTCCNS